MFAGGPKIIVTPLGERDERDDGFAYRFSIKASI